LNKISIHIDYSKDKQKFKSLFDSYYTPLCFFANKYLQNMSVSKDLVQEIFVNIWEGKIIIKSEQSLKSFLYTITKNNCIDYIKLKIKEKSQISETIESLSDDIAERYMLEEEIYNNINLAIKNLSNKAQEIIILSIGG
jgi:RNA polymerase sigma-70 factor (ECF subfamily)